MALSPVARHWAHVEALRQLHDAMPAGPGRARVKARWEASLTDHRKFVKDTKSNHNRKDPDEASQAQ